MTADPARRASGTCFAVTGRMVPRACGAPTLSVSAAQALAELIPLLGCGEEAAALAFDGLARGVRGSAARASLAMIAHEEREHDALLQGLAAALPPPSGAVTMRQAARRFHVALGCGGPAQHLARIAAIDAAVCTTFSRLLAPGRPLCADRAVNATLRRIHRDEARHVAVSRALTGGPKAREVGAAARVALAQVLRLGGDALERLEVDTDRLFGDVARLPDGLFAR